MDVFPDSLGALPRAREREVAGVPLRVLDANDILDHKLATLARASGHRPVDEKHYRDALILGSLRGRSIAAPPVSSLRPDLYSRDVDAACAPCGRCRSDAFPLAPKQRIRDILGYV